MREFRAVKKQVASSRRDMSLILSGAATITFDQSMAKVKLRSTGEALAEDWRAVGRDMKRALASVGH
jgi:hypothetical protein